MGRAAGRARATERAPGSRPIRRRWAICTSCGSGCEMDFWIEMRCSPAAGRTVTSSIPRTTFRPRPNGDRVRGLTRWTRLRPETALVGLLCALTTWAWNNMWLGHRPFAVHSTYRLQHQSLSETFEKCSFIIWYNSHLLCYCNCMLQILLARELFCSRFKLYVQCILFLSVDRAWWKKNVTRT